jgi:hypothetical protein
MRVRANREMTYMSRMLKVGDEFEATPVDAKYLLADASVEEIDGGEERPRRGRPPRQAAAAEPQQSQPAEQAAPAEPAEPQDEFTNMTVTELRELAEARGLELDSGYVKREELLALLRGQPA